MPEYPSVQGTIKVVDFNQNFYYSSCSNCNRATHAHDDASFWCNYCDKKVPSLPRIKFDVEINDATGSIPATIFMEKAEELYNITAAEIINNRTDGNLSIEMIQKLSAPKNSAIMLSASMYTYGAISQCVFSVYSIINSTSEQQPVGEASSQALGPNTPQKHPTKSPCTAESATNKDIIEEDEPVEPLKNKQKKQ